MIYPFWITLNTSHYLFSFIMLPLIQGFKLKAPEGLTVTCSDGGGGKWKILTERQLDSQLLFEIFRKNDL